MSPEAQRNLRAAMADPYYRYGASGGSASTDQATVPMSIFPGYISSDPPHPVSQHTANSTDFLAVAPNYVQTETSELRPSAYSWDDDASVGVHPGSVVSGVTAGSNIKAYPSVGDSYMLRQQQDTTLGIVSGNAISDGRLSVRTTNGAPVLAGDSNILFVDGLPTDCTRREVGHLFRPFIGFKDVKVVHKEPRHSRDKAMVLCFVEFDDSKCALTALEALQGYRFDDRKPDSNVLKISFAHFPFRLPSDH